MGAIEILRIKRRIAAGNTDILLFDANDKIQTDSMISVPQGLYHRLKSVTIATHDNFSPDEEPEIKQLLKAINEHKTTKRYKQSTQELDEVANTKSQDNELHIDDLKVNRPSTSKVDRGIPIKKMNKNVDQKETRNSVLDFIRADFQSRANRRYCVISERRRLMLEESQDNIEVMDAELCDRNELIKKHSLDAKLANICINKEGGVGIEEEDELYSYDYYIRDAFMPEEKDMRNVNGILKVESFVEGLSLIDEYDNDTTDSDAIYTDLEDSNAEDYYGNDYPEDENYDSSTNDNNSDYCGGVESSSGNEDYESYRY